MAAKGKSRTAASAPAPEVADSEATAHIHASLRPFAVPLASLTLDPTNARTHDDRNLQTIEDSLRAHGQVIPIVVQKEGRIVRAGNGRCRVLRRMGHTMVAALVVAMEDVEAVTFALRDNRTSELAAWDFAALAATFKDLTAQGIDLLTVGWAEEEFGPLMEADWTPPAPQGLEAKPTQGTGDKRVQRAYDVTDEQATVIDGAVAALREREQDETIKPGRALELICADFLAGVLQADAAGE